MVAATAYPAGSGPHVDCDAAPGHDNLLDVAAREFLGQLHRRFEPLRQALLQARQTRQAEFDAGALPGFRADTRSIREGDWRVAPIPAELQDRRVEITGPVDRKMIINALNSGAKVFMADFEDSNAPTWANQLEGQHNLRDAANGQLTFDSPEGKSYRVGAHPALLMVRPRGWHLPEQHVRVDGEAMSGALFDFGLYAFHNARTLLQQQRGPYFYLPKLQGMEEAALWDDALGFAEQQLGLPLGSFKVTVLIETLPAVFQMHEILHALRRRIVGLNCGRWDYIFSYLKTLRAHPDRLLPERGQVGMGVPFLKAYSELLIKTCHQRGALAMGGMAAQIPIKGDEQANQAALEKVRADKLREVRAGHDGTWVAHPALVPVATEIFDSYMPGPNQLGQLRLDVEVSADQLLEAPAGSISRAGFENSIEVCLRYTASWLAGQGCVPIHHLMEDAATAEISRAQLWQWLHYPATSGRPALQLTDGSPIDFGLFDSLLEHYRTALAASQWPGADKADAAAGLLASMSHASQLTDFLTLPAYRQL
ncbi:malate synthase A [Frateuria aurantia]